MRFRNRNREIEAKRRRMQQPVEASFAQSTGKLLSDPVDKRMLIFDAVAHQLEQDNKRPWNLSQKLNESPYRYTRDTLWAALNSISAALDEGSPRLIFATEDEYIGEGDFFGFVTTCLSGTVSRLINAIVDVSRWPK